MAQRELRLRRRVARLRADLHASRRLLRDVLAESPQPMVVHSEGIIRLANLAAATMAGLSDPAELEGRQPLDFVHVRSRESTTERIASLLRGDHRVVGASEAVLTRPDGGLLVVETVASLTTWEGRPAVQVVIWDVTERRRSADRLAWAATHDSLTRLLNRQGVRERLAELLAGAGPGQRAGLLVLDLDGFKAVNDARGHLAGDSLLCAVGRRIERAVPAGAGVGRLGGDEFVVVLAVPHPSDVRALRNVLAAIFADPFAIEGGDVTVGASIGVICTAAGTVDEVLRAADEDMYRSKRERSCRSA